MKTPTLGNPQNTIEILQKYNFNFQKKFGQNFLIDEHVLGKIIRSAEITEDDFVIEIGPGIGTLTQQLALRAEKVTSVELDQRLLPILEETVGEFDNLHILHGDILQFDVPQLLEQEFPGMHVAVCANLPYYITSPVIMKLLEENLPVKAVTVMVQKEAAQRLCAAPGTRDAGAISYAVAYYAEPKLLFSVQPGSFYPAPKVTSAVIRLDVREKPAVQVPNGDEAAFFALIRAAFSQRRKTAANAIANGLHLPKAQVIAALQAANLDERARPEQLTLEDYCALQTAMMQE